MFGQWLLKRFSPFKCQKGEFVSYFSKYATSLYGTIHVISKTFKVSNINYNIKQVKLLK